MSPQGIHPSAEVLRQVLSCSRPDPPAVGMVTLDTASSTNQHCGDRWMAVFNDSSVIDHREDGFFYIQWRVLLNALLLLSSNLSRASTQVKIQIILNPHFHNESRRCDLSGSTSCNFLLSLLAFNAFLKSTFET